MSDEHQRVGKMLVYVFGADDPVMHDWAAIGFKLQSDALKIARLTAWKDALMKELTVEQLKKADRASLRVAAPSKVSAGE
jgi:hypothetical protein